MTTFHVQLMMLPRLMVRGCRRVITRTLLRSISFNFVFNAQHALPSYLYHLDVTETFEILRQERVRVSHP